VILESTLRGKKAVMVNFWFCGCPACHAEFLRLQRLYSELKDKGMEVVAIDLGDSADVINEYINRNQFSFLVGMGGVRRGKDHGIVEQYGVQDCPTNYVLDESGKVVWRRFGFSEKAVRAVLARLGVK
jgi:thiol-disulfide isomerase/thioredoxin